jgi:hypothetical protein
MLSLNNTYSLEDLNNFESRNNKILVASKYLAPETDDIDDLQIGIESDLFRDVNVCYYTISQLTT